MIQRIQTLFLLEIFFLGISLLFVPVQFILLKDGQIPVHLLPFSEGGFSSGSGHYAAIILNFTAIMIAGINIFLYKKRDLQVKLCYSLMAVFFILTAMLAFCPFIEMKDGAQIQRNVFAYMILAVCIISSALAARFIKKDIELLKSTDRIR